MFGSVSFAIHNRAISCTCMYIKGKTYLRYTYTIIRKVNNKVIEYCIEKPWRAFVKTFDENLTFSWFFDKLRCRLFRVMAACKSEKMPKGDSLLILRKMWRILMNERYSCVKRRVVQGMALQGCIDVWTRAGRGGGRMRGIQQRIWSCSECGRMLRGVSSMQHHHRDQKSLELGIGTSGGTCNVQNCLW